MKAERAAMLASLAALKRDPGKAGGELQREDVRLLRRDLVLKLQKLNELKQVRVRPDEVTARSSVSLNSWLSRIGPAAWWCWEPDRRCELALEQCDVKRWGWHGLL